MAMNEKDLNKTASLGLIAFGCFALSACASLPNIKPLDQSAADQSYADRLPPQNLAPGKCGLFIWASDTGQKFIGFDTEGEVKLVLDNRTFNGRHIYGSEVNDLERSYKVKSAGGEPKDVSLSLVEDKEITEGTRYYGRLKSFTDEGWERLTPIIALYSCVS